MFFHGGHLILSGKLVSNVEIDPRGPKNKHFRITVNIEKTNKLQNKLNVHSHAPLGQFQHMIPTFHSELSALYDKNGLSHFFYRKEPFGQKDPSG